MFLSRAGRLGVLLHAAEYPARDDRLFPYDLGYCQEGSDLYVSEGLDLLNYRNYVWYADNIWRLDCRPGSRLYEG